MGPNEGQRRGKSGSYTQTGNDGADWEEGRGFGGTAVRGTGSTHLQEAQPRLKSRAKRTVETAEGVEGPAARLNNLSLISHSRTYMAGGLT